MLQPIHFQPPKQLFTHTIQTLCIHILMWCMQPRLQYRSQHLQKPRLPSFFEQTPPSNSHHPQIVATQLEALNEILAVAIICRSPTHVWEYFLTTITMLALELSMLYKSFPQLTAELRGGTEGVQQLSPSHSYQPYPPVVDACGLSNKRNATFKQQPHTNERWKNGSFSI